MSRLQLETLKKQIEDALERYPDNDSFFVQDDSIWVKSTFGVQAANQSNLDDFEAPDDLSDLNPGK